MPGAAQTAPADAAPSSADATAAGPTSPPPSAARGASRLILLQVASRLVTFVANQLLVRLLTAPLLGLATQLDIYYLSVLFFARDSLRVAVQRQAGVAPRGRAAVAAAAQAIVNLGHVAPALGAVVAAALAWLYMAGASPATLARPHLVLALRLYAGAALVELLAEPCFVLVQTRLRFATCAAAEALATLLRCLVVFGAVVAASRRRWDLGVLPFALGQLAYAFAMLAVYLVAGRRLAAAEGFSLLPRAVGTGPNLWMGCLYRPTVSLAASMMAQSVVKHLLSQGDTFLVSMLASPEVQGVYALANNYGGLVARLVLQPIEESSRGYFSRLLSADDGTPSAAVLEARRSLTTLTRLYVVLSAVAVGVGPFAAPPLLALVAGRRWTGVGAGDVLAIYCLYVPFLALNGLAESFVASVATERQVHRQSLWMGVFSVTFAAAAYLLMRVYPLGARGLVLANMINMLCRIVWSAVFVKAFFAKHRADFSVASLLPRSTLAVSLATFAVLRQLHVPGQAESEPVQTLAKVAGSAVPLLLIIVYLEKSLLLECFGSIRGRKRAKP